MSQRKLEIWEWIKVILIALILAMITRTFLITPIVVKGESMMPTLNDNDRILLSKISYHIQKPKRFDIVVFHATADKDYIKRVIGLPGDTIEYKDDVLYVNGKAVPEPYLTPYKKQVMDGMLTYNFNLKEITGKQTVPKGQVFVLGDNRRFSKDSRIIGTVPMDQIVGKAKIVFWPISDFKYVE